MLIGDSIAKNWKKNTNQNMLFLLDETKYYNLEHL